MLTPQYLQRVPDTMVELYAQAEMDILADMARRISGFDLFIPSAQYQLQKLEEMGAVRADILAELGRITGKSQKELAAIMRQAGMEALTADEALYRAAGLTTSPLGASAAVQEVLAAGLEKTGGLFTNLTKTTANTATKQFERALDRAYMQVTSGAIDPATAVRGALKTLAKQGVGAVEYPSGHADSIEVAVRRAVVTGVNQTTGKMQQARAGELGVDLVETTAHAGARPSHAAWQGQIFSLSGRSKKYPSLRAVTGYETGAGLMGWNCSHSFRPYIEGFPRAYSEELLQSYQDQEYVYNGQRMTEYEASQQQRGIERQIRRWKRENAAMDAAGLDTAESTAKIKQWQSRQEDFIRQTGLKRQGDRENIAGCVDSALKRDILKLGRINEDVVAKMSFSEMADYVGKLSDRAARKWYKYHDAQIPDIVGTDGLLEDRARRACDLRNTYRTQTRDLMRDQELRKELDRDWPNKSFEQLLEQKMREKGMSRDQALQDILNTATKTNKGVNKKLGLE